MLFRQPPRMLFRPALPAGLLLLAACDVSSRTEIQPAAAPSETATVPALPGFRRGINLGNALDAPTEGEWGVTLSSELFGLAAEVGFDHVRLPVRFSGHAAETAPYALDPTFLERVDWALDQAQSHQLGLVLDLHHYEELHEDLAGHRERFLALWAQLAERYRNRPSSVVFELLNEPHGATAGAALNALYADALSVVRETNPERWILLDSTEWADASTLSGLSVDDPHVAVSFHAYNPKLFTVQGSPWMPAEFQTTGVLFPGPPETPLTPAPGAEQAGWVAAWFAEYNSRPADSNPSGPATIRADFELATAYGSSHGVPVYVGEFAAVDFADETSRAHYLRSVRTEAEARNMAWCVWDDGGHNQLLDLTTGALRPTLRDALLAP